MAVILFIAALQSRGVLWAPLKNQLDTYYLFGVLYEDKEWVETLSKIQRWKVFFLMTLTTSLAFVSFSFSSKQSLVYILHIWSCSYPSLDYLLPGSCHSLVFLWSISALPRTWLLSVSSLALIYCFLPLAWVLLVSGQVLIYLWCTYCLALLSLWSVSDMSLGYLLSGSIGSCQFLVGIWSISDLLLALALFRFRSDSDLSLILLLSVSALAKIYLWPISCLALVSIWSCSYPSLACF